MWGELYWRRLGLRGPCGRVGLNLAGGYERGAEIHNSSYLWKGLNKHICILVNMGAGTLTSSPLINYRKIILTITAQIQSENEYLIFQKDCNYFLSLVPYNHIT